MIHPRGRENCGWCHLGGLGGIWVDWRESGWTGWTDGNTSGPLEYMWGERGMTWMYYGNDWGRRYEWVCRGSREIVIEKTGGPNLGALTWRYMIIRREQSEQRKLHRPPAKGTMQLYS